MYPSLVKTLMIDIPMLGEGGAEEFSCEGTDKHLHPSGGVRQAKECLHRPEAAARKVPNQ